MKRTTQGLRDVLFTELEMFLSGEVSSEHVATVTKATGAILATVAKDLEAAKMINDMRKENDQPKSIADLNLNLMLTNRDQP